MVDSILGWKGMLASGLNDADRPAWYMEGYHIKSINTEQVLGLGPTCQISSVVCEITLDR